MSNVNSINKNLATPAKPGVNLNASRPTAKSDKVRALLTELFGDVFYTSIGSKDLFSKMELLLKQGQISVKEFIKLVRWILRHAGMYIYFSDQAVKAVFGDKPNITLDQLIKRLEYAEKKFRNDNAYDFFASEHIIKVDTTSAYGYLKHIPPKEWARYHVNVLIRAYGAANQPLISDNSKKIKTKRELSEAILEGKVALNAPDKETQKYLILFAIRAFEGGMNKGDNFFKITWADIGKRIGLPNGKELSGIYLQRFIRTYLIQMLETGKIASDHTYTPKTYPKDVKNQDIMGPTKR